WVEVWARRTVDADGRPRGTSGTLADVTERMEQEQELRRRDDILEAVGYASKELLRTPDWERRMNDVLERLGRGAQASRVYVFRSTPGAPAGTYDQLFEWCAPGIPPQIDNPDLQGIALEDAGFGRWESVLRQGMTIHGRVDELPASERGLLQAQDILAVLIVPVFVGGSLWGFMGFDDCRRARAWTPAEEDALRGAAGLLAAAVERRNAEAAARGAFARELEVERLRERDEFRRRFVNTAAHEINTPLTPILLQLHSLSASGEELPERARRTFEVVHRNLKRLASLAQDLLDVARLESGRIQVRREPVRLDEVAREAADTHAAQAAEAGVRLECRLDGPLLVSGDGTRLAQVVSNLLSNAMKATSRGGRVVVRGVQEDGRCGLVVEDDGHGFAAEDRPRLFQPFSRIHAAEGNPRPGTGLGLYICRTIVEAHGGTIEAESPGPGAGAAFRFLLPVKAAGSAGEA
ncbi:MAG TPA: GAF domain-containing sensor histidine kinase, partial [Candidatus Thermoplasmatota archaeon]|nr:GAF domain-containing sensor histidine kinase [Candidatus Thermoplasmatota archaeon]